MSQTLQIHDQLREMILALDLAPGEKLTERWLEGQFAGSRTPVRAALLRLEAEELVQREGRAWIVAPIDLSALQALSEYREALEVAAVRLACARADTAMLDDIAMMLDSCQPDTSREEWHRVGTAFHLAIARLSGNPFFLKAMDGVMTKLSRARWLDVWAAPTREQAWAEHRQIVELIRHADPEAAAQAAANHIHQTRDRLLHSLNEDRKGLKARGFAITGGR